MILTRNGLTILDVPSLSPVEQAAVDAAVNPSCYICLTESPRPEPCGCACPVRNVHPACQASLVDLRPTRSTPDLIMTNCTVCTHLLSPSLILLAKPQALCGGSAELHGVRQVYVAVVIAAAQLRTRRPRLSIATSKAGLRLAIELLDVKKPAWNVVKEMHDTTVTSLTEAVLSLTELVALGNAAVGRDCKAQDFMAAVTIQRQQQKYRNAAAEYSATVSSNNQYVIDALRGPHVAVSLGQLEAFVKVGSSLRTDSFTVGVLATNLGAGLFMQAVVSLADIELAARLCTFAHGAMTVVCGRQHRHTQQAARNADVVLRELDRRGAKSDGSKRSTCILRQVRRGYWPGLMKPVITRVAGTGHIPRLARTVC